MNPQSNAARRMRLLAGFLIAWTLWSGLVGCTTPAPPPADRPLGGARIHADVERYSSFGFHRFGTPADRDTTQWIATELERAGFDTSFQPFTLPRQYFVESVSVRIGDSAVPALPFWWPPPEQASFRLRAPIAPDTSADARGQIVWVSLPFDRSAYVSSRQRDAIAAAARRAPAAIVLTVDSPGEQPYAYNVGQSDAPWPVPVVVVGSSDAAALRAAQAEGRPIEIAVSGRYATQVGGRNVVARLNRGAARTFIVSTPTTGWFNSACERGSGVAVFLALARSVAASRLDANFVFVATAGHEIGHGGMEVFMRQAPPAPAATIAWLHLGASVACYDWRRQGTQWVTDQQVDPTRTLFFSESLEPALTKGFDGVAVLRRVKVGQQAPPGELRDIHAAGYQRYFGLASGHRFFHSPGDLPTTTGPEVLQSAAGALSRTIELLVAGE